MHRRIATSICILLSCTSAHAGSNLDREVAAIAQDVQKFLRGHNETDIAVGLFGGPGELPASAGPAVAKTLCDALQKLGVTVRAGATFSVEGSYRDVVDTSQGTKLFAAQLEYQVVDRQGNVEYKGSPRGVFGDATLPALFGVTADLPTKLPPGDASARLEHVRNAAVMQAVDAPQVHLDGSKVSASAGSPYAVELVALPRGGGASRPRTPENQNGLAFVAIDRGECYHVRLFNDSDLEAAVNLTIDGLSMFAFSDVKNPRTGEPSYDVVIVPPRSQALIKGWHRTNESSDEFVVTEYARSAAAELKSTANLGMITATFSAAWPKDQAPPRDEPSSRGENATGRGRPVESRFTEVERTLGLVRATVSVRYSK